MKNARPTVVAVIPARSGSKGLPHKNIKIMNGKPLMVWSIEQAIECEYIDDVIVSTDSKEYAQIAKESGAQVPFETLKSLRMIRQQVLMLLIMLLIT